MDLLNKIKNKNYLICKEKTSLFNKYINIGDYVFHYQDSEAYYGNKGEKSIIIFGTIVNSHNPDADIEDIMIELLEVKNFKDLIYRSKKMAGRFVIVYNSDEGFFVLPDAAASIHVAYTISGYDLYVSSNPKIIADIKGFNESYISKKIKSRAENTHPLPYDMTMYDQIKIVIPNHYLDCNRRLAIRYYPVEKEPKITVDEAAVTTSKLVKNIISGYYKNYKLSLPLTSGIDSRTILSLCKNIIDDIPIYTFFHDNFNDKTPDIIVPKKITSEFKLNYNILKDLELPSKIVSIYKRELGSNTNISEARNAWTYLNSKLNEYVRLDGNIIPLAKSNFGKNLPELFATSSYLVTKTHNYAKENKNEVKRWIEDIDLYSKNSNISKYDLFFWEHRVGKWTSNSYLNSDLLINSINPFNCRELIEFWLRVPRKERMNGDIHKRVIELNWPELLMFPINPNNKYEIFYKNSFLFYIASRGKYILERNKYWK